MHSSIFKPINVRLFSRRLQKRSIDKKERTQKKIECEYQQKKKKGKENKKQKGNIMERFYVAEKSDIQELKNKTKNSNTTRSTCNWIRVFQTWAKNREYNVNLNEYDVETLNTTLEHFYAEVRKQNGKDYEPDSLAVMQAALDRFLREKDYPKSIIKDNEFKSSKEVLEGKARMLRESGLGKKPNASRSLTKQEEEVLWDCGELGSDTPSSLQNTLWFFLGQHLGFRGRQEHYSLKVEHFKICISDNGTEYLTFVEGITKTRQGGLHKKPRLIQPKMFATGTARCPLSFFKKFISKRPPSLKEEGPFYLSPIINPVNENIWYKTVPLGVNSLNNILKTMVERSPLTEKTNLTNHSVRKTVVKKLKKAGYQKAEIVDITGHSSVKGLNSYCEGDELQQQQMSNAIEAVTSSKHPVTGNFDFGVFPREEKENKVQFNFFNCNVTLNAGSSISSSQG